MLPEKKGAVLKLTLALLFKGFYHKGGNLAAFYKIQMIIIQLHKVLDPQMFFSPDDEFYWTSFCFKNSTGASTPSFAFGNLTC